MNISPPILELAPPSMAHDSMVLAIAAVYTLLCITGLCGNTYVLTVIRRYFANRSWTRSDPHISTFIYVTFLSFADLLVIMSLPLTISYILLAHWIFGPIMCKIYWTFESVGKILSTFILTALSWDRYSAVCHPARFNFRTGKTAAYLLLTLTALALLVLSPLPYYAETRTSRVGPITGRFLLTQV